MLPPTTPSATFCVVPWMNRLVSERGRIFPCAFSMESGEALRDETGRFYSAAMDGELDAAWNSEALRSLRKKFLRGEKPQSCSRCFRLEQFQLQSLREVSNRHWGHLTSGLLAATAPDGSVALRPSSLDLRFGNFCNLRCRMCSPESSVKIMEEFKVLHPNLPESYFKDLQNLDWFRSETVQRLLLEYAPDLTELHFAGGEPFLIPEVADFLEKLINTGEARHITVTFNTNLTLLPEKIYRLWRSFKKVKVFVSLDGLGAVNNYIRFPSDFTQIQKNLSFLDEHMKELSCSLVCVNTTVQMYNILSLDKLIEHMTTAYNNIFPFPILSPLHWPEYFCITVLPQNLKLTAEDRLLAVQEKMIDTWRHVEHRCDYPAGAERFAASIRGLTRFMLDSDHSSLLADFRHTTAHFDTTRKQNLAAIEPLLAASV